jgi:hypothetical protein
MVWPRRMKWPFAIAPMAQVMILRSGLKRRGPPLAQIVSDMQHLLALCRHPLRPSERLSAHLAGQVSSRLQPATVAKERRHSPFSNQPYLSQSR